MNLQSLLHGRHESIYLFPIAFLLNSSSTTILLICVGLAGNVDLAAEIGIVQGSTLAFFHAFSGNARNIILNDTASESTSLVFWARMYLLLPLSLLAILASVVLAGIPWLLVVVLVFRRGVEWLSEIYLSHAERGQNFDAVLIFVLVQGALLAITIVWVTADLASPLWGLGIWALLPVILIFSFLATSLRLKVNDFADWLRLFPHFGSTAVIGVTVFVFRLFILLLAEKSVAGTLFTAFALGGLLGSVYAQALGPSLEFQEGRGKLTRLPAWLLALMVLNSIAGVVMLAGSISAPAVLLMIGKSTLFWTAMGASMLGATVMVLAQRFRLRLLQRHADADAFGPDVLANVLIIACVPYGFYLLGPAALAYLFLANAIIALLFYYTAEKAISVGSSLSGPARSFLRSMLAFFIAFPLFFQLRGTIFNDSTFLFSSEGVLLELPIPFSVLACYGGILLLSDYRRAHSSLWMIFIGFLFMVLSTVITTHGESSANQGKLILLIQFLLPMFAIVFGQMYETGEKAALRFQTAFLAVVCVIIVPQLVYGYVDGWRHLSPYMYFFAIYQHLQYVPMILICAYLTAVYALWDIGRIRYLMLALAIPMGVYVTASTSLLTMLALLAGIGLFLVYRSWIRPGPHAAATALLLALTVAGGIGYVPSMMDQGEYHGNYVDKLGPVLDSGSGASGLELPVNVAARLSVWEHYAQGFASSSRRFFLGHPVPPDRDIYPSAHNYYLDFAYNFGFIALIPMLALLVVTMARTWGHRREVLASSSTLGLVFVVFFLLLLENSLKVGLRQPYPGIFTFFLWGILLSRLSGFKEKGGGRAPAPAEKVTPGGR